MNAEVSVVIVSFNTREILARCLASLLEFTKGPSFEIIVVDNASTDGSADMIRVSFPSVTVLQNDHNLGFASAQNRGLLIASGEYVLVLNSDILFVEDSLAVLLDYLKQAGSDVGAVGPTVTNNDGTLAPSARRNRLSSPLVAVSILNRYFPFSRWIPQQFLRKRLGPVLARAHDNFASHDEIRSVDYVDGMCCLFKTSVLRQVGLFDEQFFFDYEIIDLANRIRSGGWSIVYYPRTSVIHLKHASRRGVRWIVIETTRSELTYYAKYYPSQVAALQSITTTVVELRMVLNRVAQWFSPNEERATEYDLLRRVLEVVEAFRASAVNGNERIPRFERLGERRLDLAEPCDKA